jgi:molecular chaperone GrpE
MISGVTHWPRPAAILAPNERLAGAGDHNREQTTMANPSPGDSDKRNAPAPDPAAAPAKPAGAEESMAPAGAAQPASHPDDLIAALRAEAADLKDRLLRAHAEMENVRKRAEREKEDIAKYAVTRLARDVVSVGDNFQRAIDAVPAGAAEQDPALKSFLEGVTMTERELLNVLERHGIKRIQPVGEPFNPHLHQAVMEIARTDVPAGTIVQLFQPGFTIEDRVLRPAMVAVAKGGPKPVPVPEAPAGPAPPADNNNTQPG